MSQYPYGYSAKGQPPQQQYPPYQPYNTYPTPNEYAPQPPAQYLQQTPQHASLGNFYVASQSAYNHNASSIPGLGIPSAAPGFAVPSNAPWSQGYGASPAHPGLYSNNPPISTSSAATTPSKYHTERPDLPPLAPTAESAWSLREAKGKEPSKAATSEQSRGQPHPADLEEEEEGEVSEPDFDDLYDDVSNQATTAPQPFAIPADRTEDLTANNSDQEPDFYDTDAEGNTASNSRVQIAAEVAPRQTTQIPDEAERDRSRSYSPYLSSGEVEEDKSDAKDTNPEAQVTSEASSQTMDRSKDLNPFSSRKRSVDSQGITTNPHVAQSNGGNTYINISEAQNEAKKAILRLLPHGVKYQTYIDEGFDAKLVKELFSQLHLPTDAALTLPSEKPAASQEKEKPKSPSGALPASQVDSSTKRQEERKDKIARLLAEKKAKAAVAAKNTQPTAESNSTSSITSQASTTPTKPPKTRAEMDRLLQQKMQALRKKAAQKPSPSSTPVAVLTNGAGVKPTSGSGTPLSVKLGAFPVDETTTPPSQPKLVVNQRKRPVAADFMDLGPTSVKRPSLANRQNSSLVISLSDDDDDEDDDEDDNDVEMEVESAEESPAPAPQSATQSKRGPSVRDYPPLTNRNSPRHVASPSSVPSPVSGTVDLQARERQIMELKRKILEAEARAKNKPKLGSVTPKTPSAGNITPTDQLAKPPARRMLSSSDADDKGDPSAQLLREAEAATTRQVSEPSVVQSVAGRRSVRVSSFQSHGKADKVREKAERLRKMQEEMMKLQAEIDEDMAEEEEGLDDEMDISNGNLSNVASSGLPQPAESVIRSDASKPNDASQDTHDAEAQSEDVSPEISAENETLDDRGEKMDISTSVSDEDEPMTLSPHLTPQNAFPAPQSGQQKQNDAGIENDHSRAAGFVTNTSLDDAAAAADTDASDDYEPPEAQFDVQPAEASPPFSPAPADQPNSNANDQRQTGTDLQKRLAELRNQLIAAKASKDQITSSHHSITEETNREAEDNAPPNATTSFVPYESPLRYFRAYRFHPQYSDDVASGLKSLTYSNRIDPKREMCPDELDGTECPRGGACQFQHFKSIVAPDNEIILDLGSSDDLNGEQKKNFNNGLRELVASFQQSKVRDFGTIAQAIVKFRRQFLGDPTKVLRLKGVHI